MQASRSSAIAALPWLTVLEEFVAWGDEILAEATGGVVREPLTQQLYHQRLNFPKKEVLEA
jgi:hypothetical protein